jgi:hypothetical protein
MGRRRRGRRRRPRYLGGGGDGRLAMCHALAGTRRLRSVRSNHLTAPSRRRAPWDVLPPQVEVSGSQTNLLTPWYDGRAEIIPFRYLPVLLGGNGMSHVGWALVTCHPRVKKLRV